VADNIYVKINKYVHLQTLGAFTNTYACKLLSTPLICVARFTAIWTFALRERYSFCK